MHVAERVSTALRHSRHLERLDWLWDRLRPLYNRTLELKWRRGLERIINGTDRVLVIPAWRSVSEVYEPEVWRSLMGEVRAGDVVADVGVYIGLYSIALAQHVGMTGRVFSFEPDPSNYEVVRQHVALNGLGERIKLIQAAVGAEEGRVAFNARGDVGHVVDAATEDHNCMVECVTLDQVFAGRRLDILKIDVEGYEEMVLRGAQHLLADSARGPRAIYVEVHPYAWPAIGTTSDALLNLLIRNGYRVSDVSGERVKRIDRYGEIVARKNMR